MNLQKNYKRLFKGNARSNDQSLINEDMATRGKTNTFSESEGKITEAYFPAHYTDSSDMKKAKTALANWFNNMRMQVPPKQLDILNDIIEDYALTYAEDYSDRRDMERSTF